ncbi:hypothetical protein EBB79_02955 [Parasedimentitalea marina]|uniref:Uncharacterized protein n=1 Tax=Parasedimentitalea marina TaxID=2483033 RepID=A0A3T0MYW4_9RHOB|nr:hypothetical protein EBB79_02955 [Parasedimentitalea marina]
MALTAAEALNQPKGEVQPRKLLAAVMQKDHDIFCQKKAVENGYQTHRKCIQKYGVMGGGDRK